SEKKSLFGLIVFKSKADLEPLLIYQAYAQRWMIETLFYLFKNIIDRDTVNVHNDYRTYATELVNFLSVIITTRVKNELVKKEINKRYSYKQVFKYLSKYKKVRTRENGKWESATMLKYIEELVMSLGV
ncbi:MAG: IS1634 family transposase, partial [Bacteroidaceae bacterium]